MSDTFPDPIPGSIFYEDEKLYACLATHPITEGHVIVVWKDRFPDLKHLTNRDYDYLMDTVSAVRQTLLRVLSIEKVYLIYMDEAAHVHWHLVPRYDEKGYDVFLHSPRKLEDLSLVAVLRKELIFH